MLPLIPDLAEKLLLTIQCNSSPHNSTSDLYTHNSRHKSRKIACFEGAPPFFPEASHCTPLSSDTMIGENHTKTKSLRAHEPLNLFGNLNVVTLKSCKVFFFGWWGLEREREFGAISSGRSHPLILMQHMRVLRTYLLGVGYLPCRKDYKVWYFKNKGKWLYFNTPYQ